MSKKTREKKTKRARRIERQTALDTTRRLQYRQRLKAQAPFIVNSIYAARPVGMKTWDEFKGDRTGLVAIVGYASESSPFVKILHSREFPNAKLRVVIINEAELEGISIDVRDPSAVLMPRVLFYSEGHAISMDVNPTESQMVGLIVD